PVHEHVDDSVSHVARRSQGAGVVPILPDAPSPPRDAVHCEGEPYRDAHEAAPEPDFVVGLYQQVNVIGLHRKMNDSEPASSRAADAAPDLIENDLLAQTRQPRTGAKRDGDGMSFLVLGPGPVRHVTAPRRTLSPRSGALPASSSKPQFLLAPALHVIWAIDS